MMKHVKGFLMRGTFFGGFGPIIYGIVMLILYLCKVDTKLDGLDIFRSIISIYMLAFIVAGVSIIWDIERIGLGFQIGIHCLVIYLCYLITYLMNGWMPSNLITLLIFTLIFAAGYGIIWCMIYIIERRKAEKLNKQLS